MNKKIVPTHKYKTTILFYDDNKLFLKFLQDNLVSDKYNFQFVDNLEDFYSIIDKSVNLKKNLPNIVCKLENELSDYAHHEAFDFDLSKFEKIRNIPDKYAEVSVVFIDNELGKQNGIDICSTLPADCKKILLTGECNKTNAIQALNNRTINFFIEKFNFDNNNDAGNSLIDEIHKHIDDFSDIYFIESNYYNNLLISSPIFKRILSSVQEKFSIIEYYLFEKDMFLLVDNNNKELLLKCWQEVDFDNYYNLHFDDFNQLNSFELKQVMQDKQIPFKQGFIDSLKVEGLYYSICNV